MFDTDLLNRSFTFIESLHSELMIYKCLVTVFSARDQDMNWVVSLAPLLVSSPGSGGWEADGESWGRVTGTQTWTTREGTKGGHK